MAARKVYFRSLVWLVSLIAVYGSILSSIVSSTALAIQEPPFDWQQAEEWATGVRYVSLVKEYPNADGLTCPNYLFFNAARPRRLVLHATRVDTQTPGIGFVTSNRAENWGEPMPNFGEEVLSQFKIRTARQTTLDFLTSQRRAGVPLIFATNAAPWSPYQSGVAHPLADQLGLAISDGVLVCPPDGKRPSLVVTKERQLDLRVVAVDQSIDEIRVAVSGFSFCLQAGKPSPPDTVLHPRTGVGLCSAGRYLVVVIIDGRQVNSQGATVAEVGQWLNHFGSTRGINMDGGGSTTLVRWDSETDKPKITNRPAHGQRANGNNLGVFLN